MAHSDCRKYQEQIVDCAHGELGAQERGVLEAHLKACAQCAKVARSFLHVNQIFSQVPESEDFDSESAVLAGIQSREEEQQEAAAPRGSFLSNLSGLPWWGVSVVLHILVILLAGLISMAIELPRGDEPAITVTELSQRPLDEVVAEALKNQAVDALHSKHETPPTDPMSKDFNNVVVPPELLSRAELGDHFETINPDRPDTQSAFGNPDATMFHSVTGSDDEAGGGGNSGASLDDMIGVGGASSPGTGGGWGGGNGTGIGNGTGAGRGSFGSRTGGGRKLMVKRHGGSAATEGAVDRALSWLARHQEADGSWSTQKHGGSDNVDAGVTALAVLAFLGAGHTEKTGQFRENVRKGVAWIISQQGADGGIGAKFGEGGWHDGYAYHHAICGLALAEAAGMARVKETVAAAQKALDYSMDFQGGEGSERRGWRYSRKQDGDTSVSGWFVMQLKSAKVAGLQVSHHSFEGALKFYDSMEVKGEVNGYAGGRFGYTDRTGTGLNNTAIGMLANLYLGRRPGDLMGGAEYLCQNPPKWDKDLGEMAQWPGYSYPFYYTYYGTLTMFQMGGDYWKKWNTAMQNMLLPKQRKGGDEDGSWDPLGASDCKMAGRVYTTAMGALSLEVYYRYALLNEKN
ncbi:MAG TPA: zf-HC2 domain-containing protein [Planctomycetota bacterium]|nr:zf-HC2 domain-containing protein [Planctomycetota bacterium]